MVSSGRLIEQLTHPPSSPITLYGLYRPLSEPLRLGSLCASRVAPVLVEVESNTGSLCGSMASCKSAISNEPTSSPSLRPHESPLETGGLPVDRFLYSTSSALSAPTQSPMDDPSDGSGQHARHDTGNTCVHRIDVGPSFSQKCASESWTHHEHTSAKRRHKEHAKHAVLLGSSSWRRTAGIENQAIRKICADRQSGVMEPLHGAPAATRGDSMGAAIARH